MPSRAKRSTRELLPLDLSFAKSLGPKIERSSSCLAQALRFGIAG